MKKELSKDAKLAINDEVKRVTDKQLEKRFEKLEENLIKDIKANLNDYLTANKYRLEEERVKNYRKRMRNTVKLILERYKEFSDFMENFEYNENQVKVSRKQAKCIMEQINIFNLTEEQREEIYGGKQVQTNLLTEEQIEKAKLIKKIFDNAFKSYKTKVLKKLKVPPIISTKEMDYESIQANELDTKKLKRKLILLQKVYIEGKTLEEIDFFDDVEYIGSKNYQNDVNSLVDDLMILIFGYEGMNYILLERFGFELL